MQYKYFLQQFTFDDFLRVSILRKKRLYDDSGIEIPLADSAANFRCMLEPSSEIENELKKLVADESILDDDLQKFIINKLIPMLKIAWDEQTIANYKKYLEDSSNKFNL